MTAGADLEDQIVVAIRRIIRAIDLHSRRLLEAHGLTGPQLATLREVSKRSGVTTSALARAVRLSQPTMSGILDRLERQGFVRRTQSSEDRRATSITVTGTGARVLANDPSLLQDRFRVQLARLEDWERYWLLAALERIAAMMDAEAIDAAPMLVTGPISASEASQGGGADDTSARAADAGRARRARGAGRGKRRNQHSDPPG